MKEYCVQTNSEQETEALGEKLAVALFPGAVITLSGDLGAGKTAFVRGVARGLHIDGISSPTFNIVQEHEGLMRLYHFDIYRLNSLEELYHIGFEDYLRGDGVVILEWPEAMERALPQCRLRVDISGNGGIPRAFVFSTEDAAHEALIDAVLKIEEEL